MNRLSSSASVGVEVPDLSEATFAMLRDVIAARTGTWFDDAKRMLLADKLAELVAVNGMGSFLEYYYALRYDDPRGEHAAALFDRLAVPETYFWRQPEHFALLGSVVAPRFFERCPGRTLRIWSGACCTGEETISIAIALAEAGLLERPVEIIGTDASRAMIAAAAAASYPERSFRQTPKALRDRYFDNTPGGHWRPKGRLLERIRYEVASLTDPATIARFGASDVIFCRNVFIYFADETVRAVASSIAAAMPPDGVLFVGAAESLTRLGVDLELAQANGAFVYVQPGHRAELEAPDVRRVSRP